MGQTPALASDWLPAQPQKPDKAGHLKKRARELSQPHGPTLARPVTQVTPKKRGDTKAAPK